MKDNVMLMVASLFSILLVTVHLSDDIVRGFEPGGLMNMAGVVVVAVWLCGALLLSERRSGYIITLLGSLLGVLMPVLHMRLSGMVGGRVANTSGELLWVWTMIAVGVSSIFGVVLSVKGLWGMSGKRR
jgi:hypothetical protein